MSSPINEHEFINIIYNADLLKEYENVIIFQSQNLYKLLFEKLLIPLKSIDWSIILKIVSCIVYTNSGSGINMKITIDNSIKLLINIINNLNIPNKENIIQILNNSEFLIVEVFMILEKYEQKYCSCFANFNIVKNLIKELNKKVNFLEK